MTKGKAVTSLQVGLAEFQTGLDPTVPVEAFCDGACSGNPGPGGWGAILEQGDRHVELSGGEKRTTNNRMELMAAIEVLKALPMGQKAIITTDSQYVKNGITAWIKAWIRNGWKTSTKQPVKNQELWQALKGEVDQRVVTWKWVRGHVGVPGNERADSLARQAIARVVMGV